MLFRGNGAACSSPYRNFYSRISQSYSRYESSIFFIVAARKRYANLCKSLKLLVTKISDSMQKS